MIFTVYEFVPQLSLKYFSFGYSTAARTLSPVFTHISHPPYPHIHTDIYTKKMARAHHVPIVPGSTYLLHTLLPCKNFITSHIDAFRRFHHGRQTSFQTSKIRIDAIASAPPPSPLSVPRIEDVHPPEYRREASHDLPLRRGGRGHDPSLASSATIQK